ncbi:MAG: HEAT repeat domain-containing protein [Anaerolineales bacterium]|nr:HEAT repeat domain-containing protein [Anaerolineales bacterium]
MTRRQYRFKNIRALLTEGFPDEDLRLKVCYDEPAFRPVYNQLSREMGKDLIIDRLIEYACQNSLLDSLLSLLRDLNPARYEQHQPYEGEPDWDSPEIATYLAAVAEAHRYLPLEGSDQRIPLTDVFVMLQAAQVRPRRDVELTEQRREEMSLLERLGLKAKKEAEAKTETEIKSEPPPPPPVEVSEVLSKHPHLIILGEPGGGKTTLLRYIALCLATNQEAKLNLTEKYLPVFLELRDFNPDESLENFLRGKLSLQLSEATIKEWQYQGRLLFLLDALDEAPPERRGKIRNRLNEFADSPKWKRHSAAKALGYLGDNRALEPLLTILWDENSGMQKSAAKALGYLGDNRAVEPLLAALRDESRGVRESAVDALKRLAPKMTEELCHMAARKTQRAAMWHKNVYELLLPLATRLVMLEVERLPAPEYPDF